MVSGALKALSSLDRKVVRGRTSHAGWTNLPRARHSKAVVTGTASSRRAELRGESVLVARRVRIGSGRGARLVLQGGGRMADHDRAVGVGGKANCGTSVVRLTGLSEIGRRVAVRGLGDGGEHLALVVYHRGWRRGCEPAHGRARRCGDGRSGRVQPGAVLRLVGSNRPRSRLIGEAARIEAKLRNMVDPVVGASAADMIRGAVGRGGGGVGTAERRLSHDRLAHVKEHVGARRHRLVGRDRLNGVVVKEIPVSVGRVATTGRVVATRHASHVVAHGVQIVDIVQAGRLEVVRLQVEGGVAGLEGGVAGRPAPRMCNGVTDEAGGAAHAGRTL